MVDFRKSLWKTPFVKAVKKIVKNSLETLDEVGGNVEKMAELKVPKKVLAEVLAGLDEIEKEVQVIRQSVLKSMVKVPKDSKGDSRRKPSRKKSKSPT